MSTRARTILFRIVCVVAAIAAVGIGGHFLIRAVVAMHAG